MQLLFPLDASNLKTIAYFVHVSPTGNVYVEKRLDVLIVEVSQLQARGNISESEERNHDYTKHKGLK